MGGDYIPQSTVYEFAPGTQSSCINILIQRDNAFELREEFNGQITSIQLPDGQIVPSATGVDIQPSSTQAFIDNVDGERCSTAILNSDL